MYNNNSDNNSAPFCKALVFLSVQYIAIFCIVTFFKPDFSWWAKFTIHLLFYLVISSLPVLIAASLIFKAKPFAYLGLSENAGRGLLYGFVVCLFISAVFSITNRFSTRIASFDNETMLVLTGLALAGLFEEIPFRGFYQRVFQDRLGFWPANLITSALFALLHLSRALSEGLYHLGLYFIISLWLGYIYRKSKSLWAPILVHACFNILTAIF